MTNQPLHLAVVASCAALFLAACGDPISPNGSAALVAPTALSPSAASASAASADFASADFALLANAAVSCTDGTVTGDVGTFQPSPTGSFTDVNCDVDGSVHIGDALAEQAYEAFLTEYAALAGVECDEVLTGTLANVTLEPGVYCFPAAAALTGELTLDGSSDGSWLFKIGTGGTGALTGTGFSVIMDGGGDPCNVTWWVDEAATMTDSDLKGNILAGAGITLTRGTLEGNAWSQADVTVSGTTVTGCESGENGDDDGDDDGDDGVAEGCTPGYWKNHLASWTPTGFSPSQTVGSVFTGASAKHAATRLHAALSFTGGPGVDGAQKILLRAAVASLLNASHPDVDFDLTVAEVIDQVDAALASGDRQDMLDLAETLDALNNAGCTLQGGPPSDRGDRGRKGKGGR